MSKKSFGKFIPTVAHRDGWNCHYCKKPIAKQHQMIPSEAGYTVPKGFVFGTIDHKIPRSKGGDNQLENFVLSCHVCNSKKSNKHTYLEFKTLMGGAV